MFVATYALFSASYPHGADPEGLMQALEELDYLAALDDDGNLSEIGIIMSEIPLEPQMAKALLASCEFDCVSEMLTVAAMLSGAFFAASVPFQQLVFRGIWLLEELQQTRKSLDILNLMFLLCPLAPSCFWEPPAGSSHEAARCHRRFRHPEGDHFTLVNIYNAFRQSQRQQCKSLMKRESSAVALLAITPPSARTQIKHIN